LPPATGHASTAYAVALKPPYVSPTSFLSVSRETLMPDDATS
jgi:hypothetical protein